MMKSISTVYCALFCLTISGCFGGSSDRPQLGLVSGKVLFEGQPLADASVTFMPETGRPAAGKTDQNGIYQLTYIRNEPGCKTGRNSVTITSLSEGEESIENEGDDFDQTKRKPVKEIVPAKYNTATTLQVEVMPGQNTFDFELQKK